MAQIKGKQLADSAITPAKIDFASGIYNFSQGATLQSSSPSGGSDVATKAYVDALSTGSAAGLDFKESVFVATTENLAATYSSNVLTAGANGALSIDGKSPAANQRILVKDQSTASHNGIYTVTTAGDGSNAFVLTRTIDADTTSDLTTGAFIFIEAGTNNKNKSFVLQANTNGTSPTLDSDELTFIQFSGAGQITAGSGLTKTGDTFDLDISATKLGSFTANTLQVPEFLGQVAGANKNLTMATLTKMLVGKGTRAHASSGLEEGPTYFETMQVKASSGITVDSTGVKAALPQVDSGSPVTTLSTDDSATGISISATPAGDSHVRVTVNGVGVKLGDGAKTSCDAYFDDGSNGARSISDIASGDELIWNGNGNTSGQGSYILESSDLVEIFYNA